MLSSRKGGLIPETLAARGRQNGLVRRAARPAFPRWHSFDAGGARRALQRSTGDLTRLFELTIALRNVRVKECPPAHRERFKQVGHVPTRDARTVVERGGLTPAGVSDDRAARRRSGVLNGLIV